MNEKFESFSLLGGPLHRLGCQLGLVRCGTNTVQLGLALGFFAWGIMLVLTLIEGISDRIFSLLAIAGHVRLLVVIPLLFVCETFVSPRITAFVDTVVRSGVVPQQTISTLKSELSRVSRWKDAWLPEALCLLAAVIFSLAGAYLNLYGLTATNGLSEWAVDTSMTGQWYWIVCLTPFRFLLFRWIWHFGLWCFILWRISTLELNLVPTHPDGAGGLGYLEIVQSHFTPMVLSISVVQAAMFAGDISAGRMTLEAVYPALALILIVDIVLFIGPLLIFTPKLWACRVKGLGNYMVFAAHYVNDFDKKWLGTGSSVQQPMLGTPDLQSLADLGNSINVVRNMRFVPASTRLLISLAITAIVPMLPLLLLKYPIAVLAEKFFTNLAGI